MKPVATYRLQFRNGMTFDRAVGILPYLKRLGISHLYASPVFTATRGSTHGYDVTDCNEIDPAIGGRDGFDRLSGALKAHGLGLILDIVPNHMAASLENPWWRSVVEWGPDSPYSGHFDIDWSQRLTLPVLGGPFSQILAEGGLALHLDAGNGCLALAYFDHVIPLNPKTYRNVFDFMGDAGPADLSELAERTAPADPAPLHDRIRRLCEDGVAAAALAGRFAELSRDTAFLEALHVSQPWELTDWREARRHLSYRRFFEVTGLVGLRVEDDCVYRDAHKLVLDLVRSGQVEGLRVDHIDGLADPAAYLRRLRADIGDETYLVVEKILEGDEGLPRDWPIDGTTGYEFITAIGGLLTDERQAGALEAAYSDCRGRPADLEAERRSAKQTMVRVNFEGEVSNLVGLLRKAIGPSQLSADEIRDAICAVIVAFPVYRTYATADGLSDRDRAILEEAVVDARRLDPAIPERAFEAVLGAMDGASTARSRSPAGAFLTRFQQLTGPVMAKAVEDTLFYRFNRLIAVNEVGGDPDDILTDMDTFHARMAARVTSQPFGLLATSTHDTKRGEDARARLYAISEMPREWGEMVAGWRLLNANLVAGLPGGPAPEPDTEWLIYQALAGVWPKHLRLDDEPGLADLRSRFLAYLEKAVREAKRRTSWTEIDERYERAVQAHGASLLSAGNRAFLQDFAERIRPIVAAGEINSLSQSLIKLTAPGIPDVYQGAERFDLSLVDPDNRRPIGFSGLAEALADADRAGGPGDDGDVGELRQWMIARMNRLRARAPDLFTAGGYRALEVAGEDSRHVVAFERSFGDARAVTVVPRLPLTLARDHGSVSEALERIGAAIRLPASSQDRGYTDVFSGQTYPSFADLEIGSLFRKYTFSVLFSP